MAKSFDSLEAAFTYYTMQGIIAHLLHGPKAKVESPGKAPICKDWAKRTQPHSLEYIHQHLNSKDYNLGANCGKPSDLTVIDIDFYIKGIWDYILDRVDTTGFVTQKRTEKDGKKHIFFKYAPKLKTNTHQALGFDIRNDGGNIVLAPSIHPEGDIYTLDRSIEERTEIPASIISKINEVITQYGELKKVILKCRSAISGLWIDIFENKESDIYLKLSIFRNSAGRKRHLALFAELLANGATEDQLLLACMLIFGDKFSRENSIYQISKIDPEKTPLNSTLEADEFFSKYISKKVTTLSQDDELVLGTEMTEAEIELLRSGFAVRHLICDLPENHFISQFLTYANQMTDGYQEYKILTGFWLLSSLTQRKPYIDLATTSDGIYLNVWSQLLGLSSLARKTTIIDIARHFFAYAQDSPLTDTDYSLEGYLETLAQTPVLTMINDEVSTVFQKMGQKYNAGYNEFECKLYDCNSQNKRLASGGKKEPKIYTVENPFITKLYGTTFVKYKRSMSIPDFDSGFGFRFLYAAPTYEFEQRPPRIRTVQDIKERSKMEVRTAQLYGLFKKSPAFPMSIDQDALGYYVNVDFNTQNEIRHKPNQEFIGSAWSRYSIYILKLAALIEIGKEPISQTITLESVKIATSMVLDYFLPTICDIYNLLTVDPKNNKIDKIIEVVKDLKGVASHSVLLRKTRLEAKEFRNLIETTIESGQVEAIYVKNQINGKKTTYYRYIDCDKIVFENPSSPNSQIPQVPRFTYTNNDVGINENLDYFRQLDCTHIDGYIKQSKIIQTHTDSRIKNSVCEPGNLENLGTWRTWIFKYDFIPVYISVVDCLFPIFLVFHIDCFYLT